MNDFITLMISWVVFASDLSDLKFYKNISYAEGVITPPVIFWTCPPPGLKRPVISSMGHMQRAELYLELAYPNLSKTNFPVKKMSDSYLHLYTSLKQIIVIHFKCVFKFFVIFCVTSHIIYYYVVILSY